MELTESVEFDGRTVACGRAGTGPAVVFCHGTPFSSREWSDYADALADRYTVHLWDMPGYGESSKDPAHPTDFGSQARAFAALLDHWELTRPHVIAHDFGGAVTLRAHLVEDRDYASLLLVDVVAIPPSGSPFFRFVGDHPGVLDELPDYIHHDVVRAYVTSATTSPLSARQLDTLVQPWLGPIGQPAFYRQIADYDESYLVENEQRLEAVRCPVRITWTEDDPWIPVQIGRRLAALVPGAELVVLPQGGHLVQYSQPVALMALIDRWLERATTSSRR